MYIFFYECQDFWTPQSPMQVCKHNKCHEMLRWLCSGAAEDTASPPHSAPEPTPLTFSSTGHFILLSPQRANISFLKEGQLLAHFHPSSLSAFKSDCQAKCLNEVIIPPRVPPQSMERKKLSGGKFRIEMTTRKCALLALNTAQNSKNLQAALLQQGNSG